MSAADAAHNRETIVRLGTMLNDLFVGVAQEAQRSVVEGSELTGAPGQPVDTGALKASWQLIIERDLATIGTNIVYAEGIEDLVGPHGAIAIRSPVGGGHSVKLTIAHFDRIVAAVRDQLANGRPAYTNEQTGFTGEEGG